MDTVIPTPMNETDSPTHAPTEEEGSPQPTEQTLLNNKVALAIQAIDLLMFQGEVGAMLIPLTEMLGMPPLSVAMILPTRNSDNIKPFLDCLRWTISTALDAQVDFDAFTGIMAQSIQTMQRIMREEDEAYEQP